MMKTEIQGRRFDADNSCSILLATLTMAWLAACNDRCEPSAASPELVKTISVPGKPLDAFDVSWVDAASQLYYLADRGNAGVEVVDVSSGEYVRRIGGFAGDADHDHSGPNAVVVIAEQNELWAGDGDSSVKVVDLATDRMSAIATGGNARADELSYDPRDHLVLVVNNAEQNGAGYFATLISTEGGHPVVGRIDFPDATAGLEQSVWDPTTGMFYLAIPEMGGDPAQGVVVGIDPATAKVVRTFPVEECEPAGLALAPPGHLLLGCSGDAIEAGFSAKSVVMNATDGSIIREFPEIGGSDEVWFNPGDMRFYLAARDNPTGPALGIIDASTNTFLGSVPTTADSKSVAVNSVDNRVLVAFTPTDAEFANDPARGLDCQQGCIAIFDNASSCSQ